jgi:hypothetical protein
MQQEQVFIIARYKLGLAVCLRVKLSGMTRVLAKVANNTSIPISQESIKIFLKYERWMTLFNLRDI